MPAALPGSTDVQNAANPSLGKAVAINPFSGPKGSPFDAKKYPSNVAMANPSTIVADPSNISTGALSTGIGFGSDCRDPGFPVIQDEFTDDYQPGITLPGSGAASTAILLAIGGGKSTVSGLLSTPAPYVAQPLLTAGNGGSRDAGAGPAFTGFGTKLVTAAADIANGAVIETGWVNRQGSTLKTGLSQFGSSVAASPAVT